MRNRPRNGKLTDTCYPPAQLKRLLTGSLSPTVLADGSEPVEASGGEFEWAGGSGNQLRVPEFESPYRASPRALAAASEISALGMHSPQPADRGAPPPSELAWRSQDESPDGAELDEEIFGDPQTSRCRAGSVSSADESPDLLEGLSDTSSSDGGSSDDLVDGWMERDRRFAEMQQAEAAAQSEAQPVAAQDDGRLLTSSEPNFAPTLAARKEQYARLRAMQSHSGAEGLRLPELATVGRRSEDSFQQNQSGVSLEELMWDQAPRESMRVQPSSSWAAASSPLLEKLKEISAATESIDEEEDKRLFFARLDASTGLDVVRSAPQPVQQSANSLDLPQAQPPQQSDDAPNSEGSAEGSGLAAYLNASAPHADTEATAEPEQAPVWTLAFSADTATLKPAGPADGTTLADSLELPRSIVLQQSTTEVGASPGSASVASTLSASSSGTGSSPGRASLHEMLVLARRQLNDQVSTASLSPAGSNGSVPPPPAALNMTDGGASSEDHGSEFEPVRARSPTIVSPGSSKGSATSDAGDDGVLGVDSPVRDVWEKSRTESWRQVPASPEHATEQVSRPHTAPSPQSASPGPTSATDAAPGTPSSKCSARSPVHNSPHASLLKSRRSPASSPASQPQPSRLPVRSPRGSSRRPSPASSPAPAQQTAVTTSLPPRSPARNGAPPVQRRSPARRVAVAEEKVDALQKQLAASEATKKVLRAELSMRSSRDAGHKLATDASSAGGGGDISESDGEMAAILKERVLEGGTLDGVTRDEMRSMERLVSEQEHMITAYQKENEKASRDLRDARAKIEELEVLLGEYASGNVPAAGGGGDGAANNTVVAGAGSPGRQAAAEGGGEVERLRLRLQQVERLSNERELELKHELDRLRQGKRLADAKFAGIDVPALQREGEKLQQVQDELEGARETHTEEVDALHKQLKWYVENQEIIDKSDQLVATQKEKIEQLEADLAVKGGGKGNGKAGGKSGAAASTRADVARIKELEVQVGTLKAELEEVLRKKHPNSLPQLIRAARPPMEEHAAHAFMTTKIKTLEATLEEKDDEHAKRLRVLRQGFERVKSQHEQRLAQLETELEQKNKKLEVSEKPHQRIKELERQLDDTRSFYTKKLRELNGKLATAPKYVKHGKGGSEKAGGDKGKAEAAPLRSKCKRLETDLAKACAEIRRLQDESEQDGAELKQAKAKADVQQQRTAPSTPSPNRGPAAAVAKTQRTPPPTAAAMIEMATRKSVTDISPLFDAPAPPASGNVQHSPQQKPKQRHQTADPSHPLHGMDAVQSILGYSSNQQPVAPVAPVAGMLQASTHEVQQLKHELDRQKHYMAVKNDEIVNLSQQLAQAARLAATRHLSCFPGVLLTDRCAPQGSDLTEQKMVVKQMEAQAQANETSPEMQRYKQLEQQVATIIQRYDGREMALRQNLRKTHVSHAHQPDRCSFPFATKSDSCVCVLRRRRLSTS